MNDLPRGTVTFLFTDIEGSTKLWQQFPDAMPAALARHHEILQRAIEMHNGYVFQIIGDAFCAAFATAFEGLDAALDAQRALRDETWGETGAIRVRMALHTGAAEVRAGQFTSGEYVSGITLSRAARLLSAGHGGQILLSDPSAALVREQLPPHTALRDMGAHRLKDLVQPQQIFQILASDLPQEFLPLKTLDALPNNLPIQLTSFIGREREIREIKHQLTGDGGQGADNRSPSPTPRLLTLTGTGGSGKTRLSLQVAADVIDEFDKGAWLVELAPLADASLVPNAVMNALGLREEAGRAPLEVLADFLRAKKLLLVLDNCEHLIVACAQLAHHLLTQCPNLKILATSREALGIAGEGTYQVPPLGIPDDGRPFVPQGRLPADDAYTARITQYDAVRLFIERAISVQQNFSVTNANAPAVAQICFRLDGIPLALELAAARIKLFSPEQIAARLDDRFRLLTGGSRTALPRQQTLRAAIEWSYSLLSEQERILFRRLAVFAGGWTFEAAEQVCGGQWAVESGQWTVESGQSLNTDPLITDVLDTLAHLVDKSLVTTEARGDETRYRMLETIREFALEKLGEAGENETTRDRYLQFFLKLAEDAEPYLLRSDTVEWHDRIEADLDNLRATLDWCQKTALGAETELRLVSALGNFWLDRDSLVEGRARISAALGRARAFEGTALYAKGLCSAAWLASFQGDFPAARSFADESLAIFRDLGDKQGIAEVLNILGVVAIDSKNYATAIPLLDEALQFRRELDDRRAITGLLTNLGWAAFGLGDYAQAKSQLEEALALAADERNSGRVAECLNGLAEVALREGRLETASELIQASLAIRKAIGHKWGIGVSFGVWGWIALLEHDWEAADARLKDSVAVRTEIGDSGGLVWCLEKFAQVALGNGNREKAAQIFGAAASIRAAMGSSIDPFDEPEYKRDLETLRVELGEEKFSAAWDAGSKLTMEQAMELALREETANG